MVPVYQDAHNLRVRWVSYNIRAIIQHHVRSPDAGHYTVIHARQCVTDDEKAPEALDTDMYAHACANMYVLVMTRKMDPARRSSQSNRMS